MPQSPVCVPSANQRQRVPRLEQLAEEGIEPAIDFVSAEGGTWGQQIHPCFQSKTISIFYVVVLFSGSRTTSTRRAASIQRICENPQKTLLHLKQVNHTLTLYSKMKSKITPTSSRCLSHDAKNLNTSDLFIGSPHSFHPPSPPGLNVQLKSN